MESKSSILTHRGRSYSLKEIKNIEIALTDLEQLIVDTRVSGLSFCQIDNKKLRWCIDQIMLRGAATSGCVVPGTEFFAEIIADELLDFILNYGYGDLAYEEILIALKINCKSRIKFPTDIEIEPVQFFGHCFNIDYFSKVVNNYMIVRNYLDRKLQNIIDGYK